MPNRLLKEGIVDSEKINRLSPVAEVFFYRLLVVADDFGRMDARPSILRARCFPLRDYSNEDVQIWLNELSQELLFVYEIQGLPYIQIVNWEQRQRSHPKYPAPSDSQMTAGCGQVAAGRGLGLGLGLGKGEASSSSPVARPTSPSAEKTPKADPPKADPVPYEKIINLYHETLPTLPRVLMLNSRRRAQIAARWKSGVLPDLATWQQYFEHVRESPFLMGKKDPAPNRKRFMADIDFLTNETNFTKIAEKKYHGE